LLSDAEILSAFKSCYRSVERRDGVLFQPLVLGRRANGG
jgi:hypothetical protein